MKNILILVIVVLAGYYAYSNYQQNGSVSTEAEAPSSEGEVKAFHPTDDISAQAQGGKGHESDGSEVHLP
jgi:hypothetical protein